MPQIAVITAPVPVADFSPAPSATHTRAVLTPRRTRASGRAATARCLVELQTRDHAAPTAKQRLAGFRQLPDWLVTGQVIPVNPAASVRGPSHSVRKGKTPVLERAEAHALLDAIDVTTHAGLRNRVPSRSWSTVLPASAPP